MKRKFVLGAVVAAMLAAAAGTYAWAATGAATQTINACVDKGGQLQLVAIAGDCKKNETPLSWNTVGQAGPPGPQGIAGRDGQTGPQGAAGASGGAAADPNATPGTFSATGQKQGSLGTDIPLTGLTHEIISPRDASSGLPTGKRQHKPFTITKEIDKATPLLLRAYSSNENLTSVLIGLLRNGQQVATIKLTNANIVDYVAHGSNESWSFTYQKIEWTWVDGGITASDDWEATVVR